VQGIITLVYIAIVGWEDRAKVAVHASKKKQSGTYAPVKEDEWGNALDEIT